MRDLRGYSILVCLALVVSTTSKSSAFGFEHLVPGIQSQVDFGDVLGTEIGNARRSFLNPLGNYRFEVLGAAAVRMGGVLSEIRPRSVQPGVTEAAKIVISLINQAKLQGRNFVNANWKSLPWGFKEGFMRDLPTLGGLKAVEYAFPQPEGNVLIVDVQGNTESFSEVLRSLGSLEKLP